MEEIIQELDKILPVVVRVHGDNHPELSRVGSLYADMRKKIDENNMEGAKNILDQLENVTSSFAAPADACPTFEKTYHDLAKLISML